MLQYKAFVKIARWSFVSLLAVISACGGGSSDSSGPNLGGSTFQQCSVPDQNQVWFDYLQDWYLFYQDLPTSIDPEAYASVSAMLNDVRSSQDRFSYIITREEYDAFFNSGSFFGYGFSLDRQMFNDSYVIRYVFNNSGAANAGLQRGDRLTTINGYTVSEIQQQNIDDETVFGPDEAGFTIDVTYTNTSGDSVTTNVVKGEVATNTVFATDVINTSVGAVGYLSFQHGFIEPSEAELQSAFETLSTGNPNQLILDLRYNGGGRVSIAQILGSLVGGDSTNGEVLGTLDYNDKHQDSNTTYRFDNQTNKLAIDRLIVLTTDNTCSASEMIINGIDPFIEVVTVGTATCGKPIGMSPQEYCDMVMSAINFKVVNAVGFGDYFDGISSQCVVNDSIVADWGSSNDPVFAEGLYYAQNSSCSVNKMNGFERYLAPENRKPYQSILFDSAY